MRIEPYQNSLGETSFVVHADNVIESICLDGFLKQTKDSGIAIGGFTFKDRTLSFNFGKKYSVRNMKLFKLHSDQMPTIYMKAESQEDALESFKVGFTEAKHAEHMQNDTFRCEEVPDLETFLTGIDCNEFSVVKDGSF